MKKSVLAILAMMALPSLAYAQHSVMPYDSGGKQFLYYYGVGIGTLLVVLGTILCVSPIMIRAFARDFADDIPLRAVFWSGTILCAAGIILLIVRTAVLH